jgi:glutamate dehydrogenase
MEMLLEVVRMLERSVLWMLRHVPAPMDMAAVIKTLKPRVEALRDVLSDVWTDEVAGYVKRQADGYQKNGVPKELAHQVASIYRLAAANDIATVVDSTKQSVAAVATIYFLVGERFGLGALRARTEGFARISHWDRLAVSAAIEELFSHQITITRKVLEMAGAGKGAAKASGQKAVDAWVAAHQARVDRYDQVFAEVKTADALSLSMLTVANRQLNALTAGTGP